MTCNDVNPYANDEGDIGIVADFVSGALETNFMAMTLVGDFQDCNAGYSIHLIAYGNRCPTDNRYGDYNSISPWW